MITLFGKNKRSVNSQITDQHGKVLFLDVTKDGSEYVLVIIYNANKESEQLKVLNHLSKLMKKVKNNTRKTAWPGRLLKFIFDNNLEAKESKTILKEKAVAKVIELELKNIEKEYDLCDIWKIRNLLEKSYFFHTSRFKNFLTKQ